ncbi:MAG TPA: copper-binding protein [Burkholderiales bacterium]|nr:copper-binding protein [Burkholderiales bacterium]
MKAVVFTIAFAGSIATVHAGDMKGMDMKDMSPSQMAKDAKPGKHIAKGTVKSVDAKAQTVTLDHEPVKSMSWPAMTMTFKVRDKAVMEKLAQGKKVTVEFEQRGKDYVITSAK